MVKYRWCALLVAMLIAMTNIAAQAQTRSGRAAYHASSSAMVTCARYEPHGSVLKVTNPETGRSIIVTVNGSGPYNGNRILDLSTGAFSALYGSLRRGVGPVQYTVLSRGAGASRHGRRKMTRKRRYTRRYSRRSSRRSGRSYSYTRRHRR